MHLKRNLVGLLVLIICTLAAFITVACLVKRSLAQQKEKKKCNQTYSMPDYYFNNVESESWPIWKLS